MDHKSLQTKRLDALLKKAGLIALAGGAYALFVRVVGWGVPCVFHLLTGWECPGCGITRMCMALLRLDIVQAARYNLYVLCLLPFALILFGYKAWVYVKTGSTKMLPVETVFYIVAFVLCVIFFILRNTHLIPFLNLE